MSDIVERARATLEGVTPPPGWMCHTYRREEATPHLPATLIWQPHWAARHAEETRP